MTRQRKKWTDADIDLVKRLYPDTRTADIAKRMDRSIRSIYGIANKLGLKKSAEFLSTPASGRMKPGDKRGSSTRFRKGNIPHNKGKKGFQAGGRSIEMQFKKGHLGGIAAERLQPLGTERITKDGIRQRKIRMDGPPQRRWKAVHTILWEEHHGPVPDGHIVVFKNGDRSDIRLENLELITRAENMRRNSIHRLPEELAEVCRLKGVLKRHITRRERHRHEKQDR
ncbi:MAG TPA: HNH endonuclease [Gammaproteobacteria bacterium]|nr:HNH endonuclease [Gammaproteobacteria bacterium]